MLASLDLVPGSQALPRPSFRAIISRKEGEPGNEASPLHAGRHLEQTWSEAVSCDPVGAC